MRPTIPPKRWIGHQFSASDVRTRPTSSAEKIAARFESRRT